MDKAIENFLAELTVTKAGAHLEAYLDRCEPIIREEAEIKDLYSISEHEDLLEEYRNGNQRPLTQEQLDFLKLYNFGEG